MGNDKRNSIWRTIYNNLASDGVQLPSYDKFYEVLNRPGAEGYKKRKAFFDQTKAMGYDVGNTYEDFAKRIDLRPVNPPTNPLAQKPVGTFNQAQNAYDLKPADASVPFRNLVTTTNLPPYEGDDAWSKAKRSADITFGKETGGARVNPFPIDEAHMTGQGFAQTHHEAGSFTTQAGNVYGSPEEAGTEQTELNKHRKEQESIEDELRKAYAERDKLEKEKESEGLSSDFRTEQASAFSGGNFGLLQGAANIAGRETNGAYNLASADLDAVNKKIRELEAIRDKGGLWRGARNALNKSNWDFGISDLNAAGELYKIKRKVDKGEALDQSEQDYLNHSLEADQAAATASEVLGAGYNIGQSATASLAFTAEFIAGGAITGNAYGIGRLAQKGVTKLGAKWIAKTAMNGAKKQAAKLLIRSTGLAARAATHMTADAATVTFTSGIAHTAANVLNQRTGQLTEDLDGKATFDPSTSSDWGGALVKGIGSQQIENGTEYLGQMIGLGWLGKTKAGRAVAAWMGRGTLGKTTQWLAKVGQKPFMQSAKDLMVRAGVNGLPEELMEEEIAIPLHAILGDDGTKFSDLWDVDKQLQLAGSVALSVGAMGAASVSAAGAVRGARYGAAYYGAKRGMNKASIKAAQAFTQEKWTTLRNELDGTANESMTRVLDGIVNDKDYNDDQKQAAVNYALNLLRFRGFNLGQAAALRDGRDAVTMDMDNAFIQGHEAQGQQMNDIKLRKDYMDGFMRQVLELKPDEKVEDSPMLKGRSASEVIADMAGKGYTDEKLGRVRDWYTAKAALDGVMSGGQDRISDAETAAAAQVDATINKDTGMIHGATMKVGNRRVYIVKGRVVLTDDGKAINAAKSDKTIFVRDAATGKVEATDPTQILSLDGTLDPEERRKIAVDHARKTARANEERLLNATLALNEGDKVQVLGEDGTLHEVVVGKSMNLTDKDGKPVDDAVYYVTLDGYGTTMKRSEIQYAYNQGNLKRLIDSRAAADAKAKRNAQTGDNDQGAAGAQTAADGATESSETTETSEASEANETNETADGSEATESADASEASEATAAQPVTFALEDQVTVQTQDGRTVTGTVVGAPNDANGNQVVVEWDEPVDGQMVSAMSADELAQMVVTPQAQSQQSAANGQQQTDESGQNSDSQQTDESGELTPEEEELVHRSDGHDRNAPKDKQDASTLIGLLRNISKKIKGKIVRLVVGDVTQRQIKDLRGAGVLVDKDWVHSMDSSAIRHSDARHGENSTEEGKGQTALDEEDYARIPDILENYDEVKRSDHKSGSGTDTVIYTKAYPDGTVYYLEEVRTGRKSLAFKTMYKKRAENASSDGSMQSSPALTPSASSDNHVSAQSDKDTAASNQEQGNAENSSETEALPPMPIVQNGKNKGEPDWAAVTPERSHAFLYNEEESGMTADEATQLVKNKIAAATKKLAQLKKKKPKVGTDYAPFKRSKAKIAADIEETQAELTYWEAVKAEHDKVLRAKDKERREREAAERERRNAEEAALKEQEAKEKAEREAAGANQPLQVVRDRWNAAPKIEGAADEIVLPGGERVKGHYVLTESGAASPSHDSNNGFAKTKGFPEDENGHTVNDRDYEHDKAAQEITRETARNYDQRALQSPVVVSRDGVVLSGNGRTMAGEIAAREGTDTAYTDYLKEYAGKYGFTREQVEGMEHPRAVFVPDVDLPYTAETFAKFNRTDQKSQTNTEQAVKMGKVVDDTTYEALTRLVSSFETLGAFYNDGKATRQAVRQLENAGVVTREGVARLFDNDGLSATGMELLETVLIGKAFERDPDTVRRLSESPAMRQRVVAALSEITRNAQLGRGAGSQVTGEDYSLMTELTQAVALAYRARKAGYQLGAHVSDYAMQYQMFPAEGDQATVADYRNFTVMMLADVLNDTRVMQLKKVLALYNQAATDAAEGQIDMFTGGVRTKKEILEDVKKLLNNGNEEDRQRAVADAIAHRQQSGGAGTEEAGSADAGDESGEQGEQAEADNLSQEDSGSESARVDENLSDPREMSDAEKEQRGELLRNAKVTDVNEKEITASADLSARKAAEKWWSEHVPQPLDYETEAGIVTIDLNSVKGSLAHGFSQTKLDAVSSLPEGFSNAVYLGTLPDSRDAGVRDHYFAYPINYRGKLHYVFCRVMQDMNKNRLYVHEVFVADNIKKGDTLQTAAFQPHGGISLYRDILANVLKHEAPAEGSSEDKGRESSEKEQGEEDKKAEAQGNEEKNAESEGKGTKVGNTFVPEEAFISPDADKRTGNREVSFATDYLYATLHPDGQVDFYVPCNDRYAETQSRIVEEMEKRGYEPVQDSVHGYVLRFDNYEDAKQAADAVGELNAPENNEERAFFNALGDVYEEGKFRQLIANAKTEYLEQAYDKVTGKKEQAIGEELRKRGIKTEETDPELAKAEEESQKAWQEYTAVRDQLKALEQQIAELTAPVKAEGQNKGKTKKQLGEETRARKRQAKELKPQLDALKKETEKKLQAYKKADKEADQKKAEAKSKVEAKKRFNSWLDTMSQDERDRIRKAMKIYAELKGAFEKNDTAALERAKKRLAETLEGMADSDVIAGWASTYKCDVLDSHDKKLTPEERAFNGMMADLLKGVLIKLGASGKFLTSDKERLRLAMEGKLSPDGILFAIAVGINDSEAVQAALSLATDDQLREVAENRSDFYYFGARKYAEQEQRSRWETAETESAEKLYQEWLKARKAADTANPNAVVILRDGDRYVAYDDDADRLEDALRDQENVTGYTADEAWAAEDEEEHMYDDDGEVIKPGSPEAFEDWAEHDILDFHADQLDKALAHLKSKGIEVSVVDSEGAAEQAKAQEETGAKQAEEKQTTTASEEKGEAERYVPRGTPKGVTDAYESGDKARIEAEEKALRVWVSAETKKRPQDGFATWIKDKDKLSDKRDNLAENDRKLLSLINDEVQKTLEGMGVPKGVFRGPGTRLKLAKTTTDPLTAKILTRSGEYEVTQAVFENEGLSVDQLEKIYNDPYFGWSSRKDELGKILQMRREGRSPSREASQSETRQEAAKSAGKKQSHATPQGTPQALTAAYESGDKGSIEAEEKAIAENMAERMRGEKRDGGMPGLSAMATYRDMLAYLKKAGFRDSAKRTFKYIQNWAKKWMLDHGMTSFAFQRNGEIREEEVLDLAAKPMTDDVFEMLYDLADREDGIPHNDTLLEYLVSYATDEQLLHAWRYSPNGHEYELENELKRRGIDYPSLAQLRQERKNAEIAEIEDRYPDRYVFKADGRGTFYIEGHQAQEAHDALLDNVGLDRLMHNNHGVLTLGGLSRLDLSRVVSAIEKITGKRSVLYYSDTGSARVLNADGTEGAEVEPVIVKAKRKAQATQETQDEAQEEKEPADKLEAYLSGMPKMQAGRARKKLNERVAYPEGVRTRAERIEEMVAQGAVFSASAWKGKSEYAYTRDEEEGQWKITKIELDYAKHLGAHVEDTIAADNERDRIARLYDKYGYPSKEKLREDIKRARHEAEVFNDPKARKRAEEMEELLALKEKKDAEDSTPAQLRLGSPAETFKERQKAAVENQGTVMPGLNDASVEVVNVPRHTYKGHNALSQAVEAAETRYTTLERDPKTGKEQRVPKSLHYSNNGVEFDYTIPKKALVGSANHVSDSDNVGVHVSVMDHLDDVINHSIEVEEHPDVLKRNGVRKWENGINKNVLVHRFVGAVEIGGKLYRVKTTMKEYANATPNKPYTYAVTTIEVLDEKSPNTSNGRLNVSDVFVSAAKLLNGVEKSYDPGKKLLDESKKADRAETDRLAGEAAVEMLRGAGIEVVTQTAEIRKKLAEVRKAQGILEQMIVFHGSPHSFEAFDHSHMGSGEGAQAHGYGTYVAASEGVGRGYAERLSGMMVTYVGDVPADMTVKYKGRFGSISKQDVVKLISDTMRLRPFDSLKQQLMKEEADSAPQLVSFISGLKAEDFKIESVPRQLYEVEVPDDTGENYFDEQGRIGRSSAVAKRILKELKGMKLDPAVYGKYFIPSFQKMIAKGQLGFLFENGSGDPVQGKMLYVNLQNLLGSDKAASELLHRAGFAGITYDGLQDGRCYVIFDEKDLKIVKHEQFLQTPEGEVYGFVKDGKVYLDPAVLNGNTPVHEYTHLWDTALRQRNPKLWQRGKELMKALPLWEEVKNDPAYADIADNEDLLASEVHARLAGAAGETYLSEAVERAKGKGVMAQAEASSLVDRVKAWLKDALVWVRDAFASKWNNKALASLSVEEFAKMPVKDLAQGFNPNAQAVEVQQIVERTQANGTFMKAPNGKPTKLSEEQWIQVRTSAFKKWFGDWEKAALLKQITDTWNGGKASWTYRFTPSEKLKALLSDKLGVDAVSVAITDSTVRHIQNRHGQNESSRGQVDFAPEDILTLEYLLNNFDDSLPAEPDKMNNPKIVLRKVTNGAVSIVTVSKGKGKEFVVTSWEEKSSAPMINSLEPNVRNDLDVAKVQKDLQNIRDAAENSSMVVDENGEPLVVYHGTMLMEFYYKDGLPYTRNVPKFYEFEAGHGFFTPDYEAALKFAGGNRTRVYSTFLNIKDPRVIEANGSSFEYVPHERYGTARTDTFVQETDRDKYDGVVFHNVTGEDNGNIPRGIDEYVPFSPNQIKSATENTGDFSTETDDIRFRREDPVQFSIREKPEPKKKGIGYKVFYMKDGKLYPPMVANPGGKATPVGVWLDADAAPVAGRTKTGRNQVKAGGKGTQGGSGQLAYRPGWHLGEIPYALQFGRVNPETGKKELFPKDFVWAEVEYAADKDYQQEAHDAGVNANGKYQHSLAGLPHLPVDGSYRYRTNPNPATDPWIITGAMRVKRVLTPGEVDEIVREAGRKPQLREAGADHTKEIDALNREIEERSNDITSSRDNGLSDEERGDTTRKTGDTSADKELVAVHNLSADNLRKSLELGGLPMPSIAVTKAKIGHGSYGEISLVFDKRTIDPKTAANRVYSGDAWTPRFPREEHKVNEKVASKLSTKIRSLVSDVFGQSYTWFYSDTLADNLTGRKGHEVAYANKDFMKLAYLRDTGQRVDIPIKVKSASAVAMGVSDALKKHGLTADEAVGKFGELFDSDKGLVKDVVSVGVNARFRDRSEAERAEITKKRAMDWQHFLFGLRAARDYEHAMRSGDTREVDEQKLRKELDAKVPTDDKAYNDWLEDQYKGIVEKQGIRNKKDPFTPSGSRRKWESLYDAVTLKSVMKDMLGQEEKGAGGLFGNNIFGLSTRSYHSLKDLKADAKKRLQLLDESENKAIRDELIGRFADIIERIDRMRGGGWHTDTTLSIVADAIRKKDNAEGYYQEIKPWVAGMTMDMAEELAKVVADARSMVTSYFEAKPRRAVGFDEVKAAIVPEGTSQDLVDALRDRGIRVETYEAGNEADRQAKVDAVAKEDDLLFRNQATASTETTESNVSSEAREEGGQTVSAMADVARRGAESLGLGGRVKIVTDTAGLTGARATARGWYDRATGQIVIVVPNHADAADVTRTLLHEAVAHYGLRNLLGGRFDSFLDGVYRDASAEVRAGIDSLRVRAALGGRALSVRDATEEYMAGLAERTDFNSRVGRWWRNVLHGLKELLRKALPFLPVKVSDSELRYVLQASHDALKRGGREMTAMEEARDVARRMELADGREGVGRGGSRGTGRSNVITSLRDNEARGGVSTSLRGNEARGTSSNETSESGVSNEAEREELETANARFNEGLGKLTERNADSVVLSLGRPSEVLESAGVADKEMKLYGNKVLKKMRKHGFTLDELRDLPKAVAAPIAVFDNYGEEGHRSILTELKTKNGNFLVAISIGKGNDIDFNIVRSVFGKGGENIADWINRGLATYIDKKKALDYLHHSALLAVTSNNQELSSAAKVVENFVNPKTEGEKISEEAANDEYLDGVYGGGTADDGLLYRQGAAPQGGAQQAGGQQSQQTPEPPTREVKAVRDAYDKRIASGTYQTLEALQDSMRSLKEFMRLAMGEKGLRMENVPDYENAYLAENALSSKNLAEASLYRDLVLSPLLDETARLEKEGVSHRALLDYMIAKHGLERNALMRQRALDDHLKKHPNSQLTLDDFADRDFSGLTSLTGKSDTQQAEAAARQLVADFEKAHQTDALWDRVNDATGATLKKLHESGILSKDAYAEISGMYNYYIPLRGFNATESREVYGYLTDSYDRRGSVMKTAHGRTSLADDPLATIAQMAEAAISQGNRNVVKQRLLNFVLNHPTDLVSVSDLWVKWDETGQRWVPVFPDLKPTDSAADVERKVADFERQMSGLKAAHPELYKHGAQAAAVPYVVQKGELREHQILVKRGGKTYVLTVNGNPRLAQAMNGMTNPDVPLFGKIGEGIQKLNRFLSANYTSRSPAFVARNFARDLGFASTFVWVKESPAYAARFDLNAARLNPVRMGYLLHKWNAGTLDMSKPVERYFKEFMLGGGETGYTVLRDVDAQKKVLDRELKMRNGKAPIRTVFAALGERWDALNRSVENSMRFTAYVTSRETGRSVERSVWDAKEISVNFNKKGAGAKFADAVGQTAGGKTSAYFAGFLRDTHLFWNPAIQATYNILSGSTKSKSAKAKAAVWAASAFALGAALALLGGMGGDDDDNDKKNYYNLPSFIRRNNLCFRAGDRWVIIPLSVEMRAFYGLGELSVSVESGNERYDASGLSRELAGILSQAMPLDMVGEGGLRGFIPGAVVPLYDLSRNRSWTDLPIYKKTDYNKDMPEWTKAYSGTGQWSVDAARWVSQMTGGDKYKRGAVEVNPAVAEYLVSQYFGGIGTSVLQGSNLLQVATGQRDFNGGRDIPVYSSFVRTADERTQQRQVNNEYQKLMEDYRKTQQRLTGYRKDAARGSVEYAERLNELMYSPEMKRYGILRPYEREMTRINSYLKELKARQDVDEGNPAQYDAMIDELTRRQADLRKEAVDRIREAETK